MMSLALHFLSEMLYGKYRGETYFVLVGQILRFIRQFHLVLAPFILTPGWAGRFYFSGSYIQVGPEECVPK